MVNIKKNTCPEEWMIQAFVDKELVGDEYADTRNHINICNECQKRVELRKAKIVKLIDALDHTMHAANTGSRVKPLKLAVWFSVAASLLLVFALSVWFTMQNQEEEECEWVVLNDTGFNPQFVSPNILYNKRVIEFKEVDMDGNSISTFLVKECDN